MPFRPRQQHILWSRPIWSIAVPVLGAPALNRAYGPRYRSHGIADHLRRQLFLATTRTHLAAEMFDLGRLLLPPARVRGGQLGIDQTIAFARALEARGCAAMHVSSGGLTPAQQIPVGPSYQVPLARAVKKATRMPVIAVGLITEFEQAEAIVGTGDADLIALARTILYNPRWPWHAAAHFGAQVKAPDQYLRSQPRQYPDLFDIGH
jgi:hypothetical protein